MGRRIVQKFDLESLSGHPQDKTAILINPPVYDTQYWAQWSQPYGLLRIASLLRQRGYRRVELFDFMEVNEKGKVHQHRINVEEEYHEEDEPTRPVRPYVIEKDGQSLELFKHHFGTTWREFDRRIKEHGFDREPPDEIWVSGVMTYWWESVRDLTIRLKRRWGDRTTILLGGIYPTLVPEHAAENTDADLIVVGEIEDANDLWTDLSLYDHPPKYAIITPSRGCPYNCAYCAQSTLNGGRRKVQYREPEDVVTEIQDKNDRFGIRDFAFYADFLLWDFERYFVKILERIVREKIPVRLHAPEGLDTVSLSRSQRLVDLMKEAHFQKLYLPVESVDHDYLRELNRKHVNLNCFVTAVKRCETAGFRLRNLEVNAFVLYGLPKEKIDDVVKTVLLVSEIVGSIIPMLFTPVPTTSVFGRWSPHFQKKGWDRRLERLNGKLYPFLEMNEGSLADYVDLQRLMYMLNARYRSKSFRLFGSTQVSQGFRDNLSNGFGDFVKALRRGAQI